MPIWPGSLTTMAAIVAGAMITIIMPPRFTLRRWWARETPLVMPLMVIHYLGLPMPRATRPVILTSLMAGWKTGATATIPQKPSPT